MALIKCPDSGKVTNDIAEKKSIGTVRIKLPNSDLKVRTYLKVIIYDKLRNILWKGNHENFAKFSVDGPTKITIELGEFLPDITGVVEPSCIYTLVYAKSPHFIDEYNLVEIGSINDN